MLVFSYANTQWIDYFTKVLEDDLKAVVKPQYVDQIPRAVKGPVKQVKELIKARNQLDNLDEIMKVLGKEPPPTADVFYVSIILIRFYRAGSCC